MLRITEIKIEGLNGVDESWEPAPLTLLSGPSSAGKTTRMLAFMYAATGNTPWGNRPGDILAAAGRNGVKVTVTLDDGFAWSRETCYSAKDDSAETVIRIGGKVTKVREADTLIAEHIGRFAPMFNLSEFTGLSADKQRERILELIAAAGGGVQVDRDELCDRIRVASLVELVDERTVDMAAREVGANCHRTANALDRAEMLRLESLRTGISQEQREAMESIVGELSIHATGDMAVALGRITESVRDIKSSNERSRDQAVQAERELTREITEVRVGAGTAETVQKELDALNQQRLTLEHDRGQADATARSVDGINTRIAELNARRDGLVSHRDQAPVTVAEASAPRTPDEIRADIETHRAETKDLQDIDSRIAEIEREIDTARAEKETLQTQIARSNDIVEAVTRCEKRVDDAKAAVAESEQHRDQCEAATQEALRHHARQDLERCGPAPVEPTRDAYNAADKAVQEAAARVAKARADHAATEQVLASKRNDLRVAERNQKRIADDEWTVVLTMLRDFASGRDGTDCDGLSQDDEWRDIIAYVETRSAATTLPDIEKQIISLRLEITTAETTLAGQADALNAAQDADAAARQAVHLAEREYRAGNERYKAAKSERERLESALKAAEERYAECRNDVRLATTRLESARGDLAVAESTLTQARSEQGADVEAAGRRIGELTLLIQDRTESLVDIRADVQRAGNRERALRDELAASETYQANCVEASRRLESDLKEVDDAILAAERERNALSTGTASLASITESITAIDAQIATLTAELKTRNEFAAAQKSLQNCAARAKKSQIAYDTCCAIQKAIRALRETMMTEMVSPLMSRIDRFIAVAMPGSRAYVRLANDNGTPRFDLGVVDAGGITVPMVAMSGGMKTLFSAGLLYSLTMMANPSLKVLMVEAAEAPYELLSQLLDALHAISGDVGHVFVSRWHESRLGSIESLLGDSCQDWDVINVCRATEAVLL